MGNFMAEHFTGWLGWCNSLLSRFAWGPATLLLLAAAGLIFSVGTGFFQLRHLPLWWRSTLGASLSGQEKGKQPGAWLPLAGTSVFIFLYSGLIGYG